MTDEEILKKCGWDMECQSPFEIRHEDGDFASGYAAQIVLDYCKEEVKEENEQLKQIDLAVQYMLRNLDWHNHDEWKYNARIIIKAYLDKLDSD